MHQGEQEGERSDFMKKFDIIDLEEMKKRYPKETVIVYSAKEHSEHGYLELMGDNVIIRYCSDNFLGLQKMIIIDDPDTISKFKKLVNDKTPLNVGYLDRELGINEYVDDIIKEFAEKSVSMFIKPICG